MTTSTATQPVGDRKPTPPPFRPVPEIIGNGEGNKRILKHDRDAAVRLLADEQRAADRVER